MAPLDRAFAGLSALTRHLDRRDRLALLGVAGLALVIRIAPVLAAGAAFPIDYDEGVYFSGAALLLNGTLPYRDFAFVHPPGVLLLLAPFAAIAKATSVGTALLLIRWCAAIAGAATTYLVGRLVLRLGGLWPAIAAAFFYATFFEVTLVERGAFTEPFLNLAAVLALSSAHSAISGRAPAWKSALAAAGAVAVKLWGAVWLAAISASWLLVGLRD